ncbi:MAG: YetF domain-containing protein [Devosia sp.]
MNWTEMFFQDWQGLLRTLVIGVLAYATIVLFLRISGKRTLAKLNAFDLVVTVALGSTLSAILLQESIALAEGALALGLLIFMQFLVAYASVRSHRFAQFIRSEPTLLARDGEYCRGAMKRERITEEEALSAVRSAGGTDITSVGYLVLESDGTMSAALRPSGGKDAP